MKAKCQENELFIKIKAMLRISGNYVRRPDEVRSRIMKIWGKIIENKLRRRNSCVEKPIRIYVRNVNNETNILCAIINEEI